MVKMLPVPYMLTIFDRGQGNIFLPQGFLKSGIQVTKLQNWPSNKNKFNPLCRDFPFYRISSLRELEPKNPDFSFGIWGSLQIRNATISFESTDGELCTNKRGTVTVPALKIRSRVNIGRCSYSELEADGIYAPTSYLNGSDNDVVRAILDYSIRMGA